ncbi:hypothetical protein AB0O34_00625 [Sphaerisporangium sp. NPDC088356]|uniref:hypothetical protein n=1 Tax=Sphaerisporangium sp. NPDC088356 TaxID=3154871 RepID=UPI00342BF181
MEVNHWDDDLIVAVVPSYFLLRTTGVKQILVTSRWGPGAPRQYVVADRGSITAWTHVEPNTRADNLDTQPDRL